ncbi:MAG: sulfurtransferase TusA family protein [Pseudohongiella sp.]|jgi:tRNA 2-thiouridine synthesizing protein A|nr:sulfurtransferase TusA family protein [Pseudohongiella sp.]
MEIDVDIEIDLSGQQCPMPLLKTKLALNNMESQQILKVVATDPGSEKDFHLFVAQSDHQILDFQKNEIAYSYWIKKG